MRKHRAVLLIALFTLLSPPARAAEEPAAEEPTLALVGGRLIDGFGGRPLENSVILIADRGARALSPGSGECLKPSESQEFHANLRSNVHFRQGAELTGQSNLNSIAY